jgi:hypothetical protein
MRTRPRGSRTAGLEPSPDDTLVQRPGKRSVPGWRAEPDFFLGVKHGQEEEIKGNGTATLVLATHVVRVPNARRRRHRRRMGTGGPRGSTSARRGCPRVAPRGRAGGNLRTSPVRNRQKFDNYDPVWTAITNSMTAPASNTPPEPRKTAAIILTACRYDSSDDVYPDSFDLLHLRRCTFCEA